MQIAIEEIAIGARKRKPVEEKIRALAESIQEVGLINPVTVTEEHALVAGWHRLEACKLLGWKTIACEVKLLDALGAELLEIDENLIRNELTAIEQALATARRKEIYELKHPETKHGGAPGKAGGGKMPKDDIVSSFAQDTASKTGMSSRTVERAAKVGMALRDIAEEVAETSIADNKKELLALSRLPQEERKAVVETIAAGKASSVKQAKRQHVSEQIKAAPTALPDGPFAVFVLDPPWTYNNRADDISHRAANPYPSMAIAEIMALPIASRACPDAILWLWTTNAHIRDAFLLIDAWGFTYKTLLTWVKGNLGLGDWLRGKTEHCLMAVRGKPIVTLTNQTTVIEGPLQSHSQKPESFFALVESLCPTPPGGKVELFARTRRPGWGQWGAELGRSTSHE